MPGWLLSRHPFQSGMTAPRTVSPAPCGFWALSAVWTSTATSTTRRGIPASAQVEQALKTDRRAAQQQQQQPTKRIPKAKKPKGVSKPKKSWELVVGVDGEYVGSIYIPYNKPKQRCFIFICFCFGERALDFCQSFPAMPRLPC